MWTGLDCLRIRGIADAFEQGHAGFDHGRNGMRALEVWLRFNLSKFYGKIAALACVSLPIRRGNVAAQYCGDGMDRHPYSGTNRPLEGEGIMQFARREFLTSSATIGAAAAAFGMFSRREAEAGDPSFMNNVPDPLLADEELPTFKFELERS